MRSWRPLHDVGKLVSQRTFRNLYSAPSQGRRTANGVEAERALLGPRTLSRGLSAGALGLPDPMSRLWPSIIVLCCPDQRFSPLTRAYCNALVHTEDSSEAGVPHCAR